MDNNERLNCDSVESRSRFVDWAELLGEDCEGWRAFEAVECEECGRTFVVSQVTVNEEHRYLEPEITVEDEDGDETEESNECPGCITFEGPMMAHFFPCKLDDCEEAARAIAHLPLCVVEMRDGETGFALTGGGMDLSWEICEAFVCCGYLPPVSHCDLPDFAGLKLDERRQRVMDACQQSLKVMADWMAYRLEKLESLEQRMEEAAD
jgi:hypothetical protein